LLQLKVGRGIDTQSRKLSLLQLCEGAIAEEVTKTEKMFSNFTIPGVSYAAALRGRIEKELRPQARQVLVADPPSAYTTTKTGLSVRAKIEKRQ
jgi:hypothetical protein